MESAIISGIQQIGIAVSNVESAWKWYRENFGTDIRIFEDRAEASFMLPYTGGQPRKRHAALTVNMQGGCGFEIWQYTERTPEAPKFEIKAGDLGIYAVKIKCKNVKATYALYLQRNHKVSEIVKCPNGHEYFFLMDPFGNIFQLVSSSNWYMEDHKLTGSGCGAVIGVSDIDKSLKVYSEILGYDQVMYDVHGIQPDFSYLPGGNSPFRRVLLKPGKTRKGAFSKLFGESQIELIQAFENKPRKIFVGRYWGDLGFIHLCFDINGMDQFRTFCESKGFPFTVDSRNGTHGNSFDMGEAAGHFAYIEDPDGTLIEFVETHKVPILKKFGLYLNLQKRNPEKSLPDWIVKALRFSRVKN